MHPVAEKRVQIVQRTVVVISIYLHLISSCACLCEIHFLAQILLYVLSIYMQIISLSETAYIIGVPRGEGGDPPPCSSALKFLSDILQNALFFGRYKVQGKLSLKNNVNLCLEISIGLQNFCFRRNIEYFSLEISELTV